MKIKAKEVSYHRNGICGAGFHVILFNWLDDETKIVRHMVGTVFEESGYCAVYDVDMLSKGNIRFAKGNSWRGDEFEPCLRAAIEEYRIAFDKELAALQKTL